MKKLIGSIVIIVMLLLIVPVVFKQAFGAEGRTLEGVRLAETHFHEISFENQQQDLKLGGLLFVPDGEGPFPGAVIIHGSGPSKRDSRWYLTLTQYLQDNGIAVLLPDKRGSEKSEGDWRTASFQDLVTDTAAAVDFLQNQDIVPISHVGLIGMSQGGHIVPLAASKAPETAFIVDVVGGAVPLHQQLVFEENHNLRQIGVLPGISNLLAYPSAWSIRELRQKDFWSAVGNFDPLPYWQELDTESLVLYGEDDTNVPSNKSAARLQSLDNPNIEVKIFEGSGHALQDPEGTGSSIIRQDALQDITQFIMDSTS